MLASMWRFCSSKPRIAALMISGVSFVGMSSAFLLPLRQSANQHVRMGQCRP
jgi:hypothetical protein